MALLVLPTYQDGDAHIEYKVTLDGILFFFNLDWNSRDQSWYLSINDESDEPIYGCQSRKLVTNWDILKGAVADDGRPLGTIGTISTDHADPGLLELGLRVGFYYMEALNV